MGEYWVEYEQGFMCSMCGFLVKVPSYLTHPETFLPSNCPQCNALQKIVYKVNPKKALEE